MLAPVGKYAWPVVIALIFSGIYCATASERLGSPSANNHYVHLAHAWLNGRLDLGGPPPGTNDWACFDAETQRPCAANALRRPEPSHRWFVSFPPFPAVVLVPFVAAFGLDLHDRFVWALLAGLAPALLFVVLGALRQRGHSERTLKEDLLLTTIFGVGSVYYFCAVQGSVWFAAHVVASILICIYLYCAIDARHPIGAGLTVGLLFLTRPTAALLGVLFVLQVAHKRQARKLLWFAVPVVLLAGAAALHNVARFGDPTEFGHSFLQVRWRHRIETWGLFSYHYLPRNLAIFLASLPWLLKTAPFVKVSGHGLALWFTTPNLLWTVWPKRMPALGWHLWLALLPVALADLLYQNSGWVQFGYRFALDYLPLLIVLLAIGGRRFGKAFYLAALFAIAVNTFGAITFDRAHQYYDINANHNAIFQPD